MENVAQKGDEVTEPQTFIQSRAAYLSHRTGFQNVTSYTQSRMFSIDYSSEHLVHTESIAIKKGESSKCSYLERGFWFFCGFFFSVETEAVKKTIQEMGKLSEL